MLSIDLQGPQGNAFFILGSVRRFMRQIQCPQEDIDKYLQEARSGDYNNLIQVSKDLLDKYHIAYDFYNDPSEESDEDDDWDDDDEDY